MREIKFRAWDKKYKQMLTFQRMKDNQIFALNQGLDPEQFIVLPKHENIELMQFTGIKNRKGEEIYEGDVVQRMCFDKNCQSIHIGVVEYSSIWCMFQINENNGMRFGSTYNAPLAFGDPSQDMVFDITILGDIYQHPELLK